MNELSLFDDSLRFLCLGFLWLGYFSGEYGGKHWRDSTVG